MTMPIVNGVPLNLAPFPNVQPFTVRDNATMLILLQEMRKWINDTLVPFVNENVETLTTEWAENTSQLIGEFISRVEAAETAQEAAEVAQLAAEAARNLAEQYASEAEEVQDVALANTLNNEESLSRGVLDNLYLVASVFTDFADTANGRILALENTTNALTENKADKTALESLSLGLDTRFQGIENNVNSLTTNKADKAELTELGNAVLPAVESFDALVRTAGSDDVDVTIGAHRVKVAEGTHSAFPSHVILPNGRIVCVYRESRIEQPDHQDGEIMQTTSDDNGRTWSAPVAIHTDALDLRDPNISLIDGNLFLTAFKHNGTIPTGVQLSTSSDGGETWSPLTRIDNSGYSAAVSAPLIKSGDYLLVPFYGKNSVSDSYDTAYVMRSADGITWTRHTIASGSRDYQEPNIITVGGNVVALFRWENDTSLGRAQSTDDGQTWGSPTVAITDASGKAALCVSSGRLLVLYRRVSDRRPVVKQSHDAGVSFEFAHVLDWQPMYAFAYGDMEEIAPGVLSVTYANETAAGTPSVDGSSAVFIRYLFTRSGTSPFGDVALPRAHAIVGRPVPFMFDDFERPAGTPGTADSGHVWTGSGFAVSTGVMVSNTSGVQVITVDTGAPDARVTAEMVWTTDGGIGIVARAVSSNTFLLFTHETNGTRARLYKVVSGTLTMLAEGPDGATNANYRVFTYQPFTVDFVLRGQLLRAYVDGLLTVSHVLSVADAGIFAGSGRYGIRVNQVGANAHIVRKFSVSE